MKKLIALIAVAASLVTASHAGLQVPLAADTNTLAINITNTYALPGDTLVNTNGQVLSANVIDCSKATKVDLSAGGLFSNITNAAQNVTVRLSGTVDGATYTNNAATVIITVPALVTNYYYGYTTIASPLPLYSVRTVENPNNFCTATTNSSGLSGLQLKAYTKTGL